MDRAETVRIEILVQCYVNRPRARDAERMARTARIDGELSDATAAEIDREASYLEGKDLLCLERDPVARAHKRWAITSAGIDHLEERGLL